ncbi:MAG: TerB family tellurite resistance protein [Alphaproteobacteria bacterium]|nr:TerB family tellurite resistance protein [Alphaproteobacteria bacterium]
MIVTKFLGGGLAMFIIGILAASSYMFEIILNPNIFTAGAGMAVLGAVLIILSILTMAGGVVGDSMGDYKAMHAGDSTVFSVGLLRCMLAITIADGRIDDSEIMQTSKIFKHLTGTSIDDETIRYTAEEMMEHGADIGTELEHVVPTLNKALKENVIVASLYILAADGDMDEGELMMLEDIREALGVSFGKCEKIKKDFLKNQAKKLSA